MQKTKTKGISVWNLANIGVMFVILTVSLGIGAWINDEMVTSAYGTSTVTNESVTFAANDTWYNLVYKAASITQVANATFTFGSADGHYATRDDEYISQIKIYTNASAGPETATAYNVSYNAYKSDSHFVTTNATKSISTLAQWLPIIAIVIAAGVVIGTLLISFSKRGGL